MVRHAYIPLQAQASNQLDWIYLCSIKKKNITLRNNIIDTVTKSDAKRKRKKEYIPSNPSEKKEEGKAMAGLGPEVGENLRDFSDAPADQAYHT